MFIAGVIAFFVVFLGLIGMWQRSLDRHEKDKTLEKIKDAVHRGSDKPLGQYPIIDPFSCIGCGACIDVCPENEVIGLVNGIAHIIHGARCVGHGVCEAACPVGAIKVGLGNVAIRPDLPVLSERNETSIPGIYIAGELGGLSLIRNAMDQGVRVIDTIAERLPPAGQRAPDVFDVVIIGTGPAGMGASLRATEKQLRYLTLSQEAVGGTIRKYPRRKLTLVQGVDIPLYGRMRTGEYEKEDLVEMWEKIAQQFKLNIKTGIILQGIQSSSQGLVVTTSGGVCKTKNVVLALGRRGTPRRLGVPGEEASKVMYELIDAASYRNQHILIVGGGDSAIENATGLANQLNNTVTISYRKENFFRLKSRNEERIRDYMARKRVRVLFSSQVESIDPTSVLLTVEGPGSPQKVRIPNDYVFVCVGGEPPFPLLKQVGIRFNGPRVAA